jgi:hypothetical protein
VLAALGYVEAHAAGSRRGRGGTERINVSGVVAAAFRHRSSRAGDPLLHTHVVVTNLGRAVDDRKWRTLDSRRLYAHAKTAGYVYQAQLRYELTRRLGVEWTPVHNGTADLVGIDEDVIRGVVDWSEAAQGDALHDLAVLTLGHEEHLGDVVTGYGTDVDLDVIRGWWSLRSLLAVRWLVEHGFDPSAPGCEFDVLRSQL